jgi:hypothetical protein
MRIPRYQHRTYEVAGREFLRDLCRDILLLATPEEFVRQDVLRYMVEELGFPLAHLFAEVPIAGGRSNVRADILATLPKHVAPRIGVEVSRASVSPVVTKNECYSTRAGTMEQRLRGHPYLHVLRMPDPAKLDVDGREVSVRLLGFESGGYSLVAVFEPLKKEEGLPALLRAYVGGWGRTPWEIGLAVRMGLALCVMHDEQQMMDFVDEVQAALGEDIAKWPFYDFRVFGEHRDCGLVILLATPADVFGVLAFYERPVMTPLARKETNIRALKEGAEASGQEDPLGNVRTRRLPITGRPVAIIECKSPGIPVSEETFDQAFHYADKLAVPIVVCTNRLDTQVRVRQLAGSRSWINADRIPSYEELLGPGEISLQAAAITNIRSNFDVGQRDKPAYMTLWARDRGFMGVDTPMELWPIALAAR